MDLSQGIYLWTLSCIFGLLLVKQHVFAQANGEKETPAPWARDKYEEEAGQTYNLVFYKYNHRVRPPQEYVNITVEFSLLHVRYLDVLRNELQTVVGMEMLWYDSRMSWIPDRVYQIMANTSSVWSPDLVFLNSISPSQSLLPNQLRIKHNGIVAWTRREVATTLCETDLADDKQTCFLRLGFMSNIRERQPDRFIHQDRSVVITPDNLINHEWDLHSMNFDFDTDNDTSLAFQMDIEITLQKSMKKTVSVKGGSNGRSRNGNPAYNTAAECSDECQHGGGDRNSATRGQGWFLEKQYGGRFLSWIIVGVAYTALALLAGSTIIAQGI